MANTVEIVLVAKDGASIVLRGAKKELDAFVASNIKAGDYAIVAGKKITTAYKDAQATALSLSRIIGVQMPEAVGKFLARSEAIAPVLNSAFSAVAVLGLVSAISQLPKIINEAADAITGWDEAAQNAFKNQISLNDKYADRLKNTQEELRKTLLAQQQAAVGAQEEFNKSIPGQLSGATGITGMVMRKLFPPPTAEQERANQSAFAVTAGDIAGGEAADRAIETSIRWLEQYQEEAKKARLAKEALFRDLGFFRPGDSSIQGALDFRRLLGRNVPPIPSIGTETEAFISSLDFAGAGANAQAAIDNARDFANRQAEIVGDAQLAAAKVTFDKQKKLAADFAQSFSNSLGAVWDDMFIRGKNVFSSLANFAASIANSIGRSFFQAIGNRILGGASGSGGLIGLATKIPGISGILGGGALAGGSVLGSTAVAGGVLAPAAAPMAIGGIGASAVGGGAGASVLGMSLSTAIPVFGAIAAAGIFAYFKLRHRTQEAPFTTDPFANQRERTYVFAAQDINRRLADALDRFTNKYDPVDAGKILQSARARRALRDAYRVSVSEDPGWAMDTGAANAL